LACLVLRHIPGLGPRSWKRLYENFDSPIQALKAPQTWREMGISKRAIAAFLKGEGEIEAQKEYQALSSLKVIPLTLWDEDYPPLLREIPDPPIVLYLQGDPSLLSVPHVALVGARNASEWGRAFAYRLGKELSARGICVVSGLARGIDASAHRGGLCGVASTIAVLGTGIGVSYPRINLPLRRDIERKGLLLSEFAPWTPPSPENFPLRNRIISGLSLAVVVVEATKKSGGLITARKALEQNRAVFAVPARPDQKNFEGNNALIREGAILLRDVNDIMEEIAPMVELTNGPLSPCGDRKEGDGELEGEDGELLGLIRSRGRCSVEEIIEELGHDPARVMSSLVMLEIKGYVRKTPLGYEPC